MDDDRIHMVVGEQIVWKIRGKKIKPKEMLCAKESTYIDDEESIICAPWNSEVGLKSQVTLELCSKLLSKKFMHNH